MYFNVFELLYLGLFALPWLVILTFGNPPRFAKGSGFEGDFWGPETEYQITEIEYQLAYKHCPLKPLALAILQGLPKLS